MNLKDEFIYALWEDTDATGDEVENKCEKIANKFAIGFADWLNLNAYKFPGQTTTKELLEIYKKTL